MLPKHHPNIEEFTSIIAGCRAGEASPNFMKLYTSLIIEEWIKDDQLVSWARLELKHGKEKALRKLIAGEIPYIRHTMLSEDHHVQWPHSHLFVDEEQYCAINWKETYYDMKGTNVQADILDLFTKEKPRDLERDRET